MTALTLDTSGIVLGLRWDALSPLAQGCVEAVLQSVALDHTSVADRWIDRPGFSDLSPDAFAMILRDCRAYRRAFTLPIDHEKQRRDGRQFWTWRQAGQFSFPPVRVSLDDAGKVQLEVGE